MGQGGKRRSTTRPKRTLPFRLHFRRCASAQGIDSVFQNRVEIADMLLLAVCNANEVEHRRQGPVNRSS